VSTFNLPDLGEGLVEAEIVAWHVAAGDHVVADQPLVSVETDKALLEVPSPRSGRIRTLHGKPGETVAVGAPLVDFEEPGESRDAGSVVGDLPRAGREPSQPAERAPVGLRASPAVRAKARRLGVDLATVAGSGPHGTISSDDVERAVRGAVAPAATPEKLRGVRRAMARNMSRAHARVVPATLTDVADVHHWAASERPMLRLVRAVVAACGAVPALNAWYVDDEDRIVRHERINLGVAADTDEGLFVPVLEDAGQLDEDSVATALAALETQVRDRSIPPGRLRGATVTLSNFGMLGGEHATLVVLPPQVAILGAGRLTERVRAHDGVAAVRRTLPLSLTFDHRAVTGAEAARFLGAAVADLQA
jgi:pyruvate dehydrogenase E2 component (dihydrolipoamide acetyltransferase)